MSFFKTFSGLSDEAARALAGYMSGAAALVAVAAVLSSSGVFSGQNAAAAVTALTTPAVTITATPATVSSAGGPAKISWSIKNNGPALNCTSVTVQGPGVSQSPAITGATTVAGSSFGGTSLPQTTSLSGSQSVNLTGSSAGVVGGKATYIATCQSPSGPVTATASVTIAGTAVATISISPSTVFAGQTPKLAWTLQNVLPGSCSLEYEENYEGGGASSPQTLVQADSSGSMASPALPATPSGVENNFYFVGCKDLSGTYLWPPLHQSPVVTPTVIAPVLLLTASADHVSEGQPVTLSWSVSQAGSCTLTDFNNKTIAPVPLTNNAGGGTVSWTPTYQNGTAKLNCGGTEKDVRVGVPSLYLNPDTFYVNPGAIETIGWGGGDVSKCSFSGGGLNATQTLQSGYSSFSIPETTKPLNSTTSYNSTCTTIWGASISTTTTITVVPNPVLNLSVGVFLDGFPALISWSAQNVTSCSVLGQGLNTGPIAAPGNGIYGNIPVTTALTLGTGDQTTYELTCNTPTGQVSKTVIAGATTFWKIHDITYPVQSGYSSNQGSSCPASTYTSDPRVGVFAVYDPNNPTQGEWTYETAQSAATQNGASFSVAPGKPVVVGWSCLNTMNISHGHTECHYQPFVAWPASMVRLTCSCYTDPGSTQTWAQSMSVTSSDGTWISSSPSNGTTFSGTQTVTPKGKAGDTVTYSLACGAYAPVKLSVTLGNHAASGAAISASPAVVAVGQPSIITATFVPGAGDALTQTAINGPAPTPVPSGYNWTLAPGLASNPPQSTMNYTFTPSSAGTYTFIPDAGSTLVPGWGHSGGNSATVKAIDCGTHAQVKSGASSCSCISGYSGNPPAVACTSNTSAPTCTLTPASQTIVLGSSASFNFTTGGSPNNAYYSVDGGASNSVPVANSGSFLVSQLPLGTHSVSMTVANIDNGNGTCPASPARVTVTAGTPAGLPSISAFSATKVQPGGQSNLSWTISGMSSGISCDITPEAGMSQPMPGWDGNSTWQGSAMTTPIYSEMTYTLSCTDGTNSVSKTADVTLVPAYKEI